MTPLLHVNVVRFIGYMPSSCVTVPAHSGSTALQQALLSDTIAMRFEQFLLWEHCEKGTLEELVEKNSEYKLDATFETALLLDVAQGMAFLHKFPSTVRAHGRLHPSTCLIDKRFSVKVAEYGSRTLGGLFGMTGLKGNESFAEDDVLSIPSEKRLYWAPEVLRQAKAIAVGAVTVSEFTCVISHGKTCYSEHFDQTLFIRPLLPDNRTLLSG